MTDTNQLTLSVLPDMLAICRLAPSTQPPLWALTGPFVALTRTVDELSIVCPQANVPDDVRCERGWRAFKVAGPLDFALTGTLASLATPLAQAGISIFAVSTFDTDYLLVKSDVLAEAIVVLTDAGHVVNLPPKAPRP